MISVQPFSPKTDFDFSRDMYPSQLLCVHGKSELSRRDTTNFGYVVSGSCTLEWPEHTLILREGMFFCIPDRCLVDSSDQTVIFQRHGYLGLTQFGGPVEPKGRLSYIDNCTATLLVSPPRLGDPCLNLLVFPKNTKQTMHIHPTIRLGVVASGSGICHSALGAIPLKKGDVFSIASTTPHCFETANNTLSVIAYHPDSDLGPTDESHPMRSRTFTKY